MKDSRRDDTNPPPPPPRRAERAGAVDLGTGRGDVLWPQKLAQAEEDRARAKAEAEEARAALRKIEQDREAERSIKPKVATTVERGTASSSSMKAVRDRWTPQNMASAAGIVVSILATAGITKGCNNEAHTQEMAAKILIEVTAVSEKITKESEARKLNDKAHDLQILDAITLASYLNKGSPNDGWPKRNEGWNIPSIGSDRAPMFQVSRGFPDLKEANDQIQAARLRDQ